MTQACVHYPDIIAAGKQRRWAWLAHGTNSSTLQVGMEENEEREPVPTLSNLIRGVEDQIRGSSSQRVRFLGSGTIMLAGVLTCRR